jgi:hypothetical protein
MIRLQGYTDWPCSILLAKVYNSWFQAQQFKGYYIYSIPNVKHFSENYAEHLRETGVM